MSAEAILRTNSAVLDKLGTSESVPAVHPGSSGISARVKTSTANLEPIVERVIIKHDALLLEHGVVLVDLPGTMDRDAARATMYKKYLQHCDHIVLVANSQRAASDGMFEKLLEGPLGTQLLSKHRWNPMKRQLLY
ncbi:hypothetical protein EXIGLDRAFT_703514 [Exidia glandulosa HHB12029]|uniref:Dynamin N-terminal domain-containing protein n=1 Tax=Exidia glandulosa HHB12029 TaxID=1314781 RepID=A0A165PVY1_EXIGL|nr:hypothetical protein EXIGLDRAFT_703514 [Exidia glandulosa HHB12029]